MWAAVSNSRATGHEVNTSHGTTSMEIESRVAREGSRRFVLAKSAHRNL
jgi:hypothetical protein